MYVYMISFTFFFPYSYHKNNGNIYKLIFDKEKYRFVIVQGHNTNYTRKQVYKLTFIIGFDFFFIQNLFPMLYYDTQT